MKETIRCCIACILPCGALDVIRIVHSNGHVEEISGTITAREIMKAHPKHVLKKPSSPPSDHDERDVISATKIVIVPPEAELQRGKIYFLMPANKSDKCAGGGKIRREKSNAINAAVKKRSQNRRQHRDGDEKCNGENNDVKDKNYENDLLISSDRYLTEILSEKVATQKDRRKGRVGVWRPHLESISEIISED
ncbi:unnamed protein product [Arabidopsis lyrata]|uniref:Uncharacterized protein n=1 Tax=Arabidopsis lyrata subsp. lyrata TaxID=81972 RepID=D7KDR1_ARALL|nr:uncharacterized protein LOC9329613 [Arabidopsis lyrata subsp. lyrata]EFH69811.1 hypothetical protein ARALYDRAFT_890439 [Arabidopsis lyrata subsp. lyrata]CAH8253835.1 unnamed protein product [Arabidopsis lyrata]|eukprot:XP_002893552.1 uncharacterized protein LOC9329613 [Arabidopsis lyrata subsp. lyrata]